MTRNQIQNKIRAITLAALIVLTSFTAVPLAAGTTDPVPSDETIEVSDNVDIWQRAVFPLRTDTSDAAYRIRNAQWSVVQNGDEKMLNKPTVGVYNKGQPATIGFDISHANRDEVAWKGKNVHLVAARVSPDMTPASGADGDDDMASLLTSKNVNSNVHFENVSEVSIDSSGAAQFEFTPTRTGQYVFFLSLESKSGGLTVANGNVSVDGQSTIIGVEQMMVQSGSSQVTPLTLQNQDYVKAGENLNFQADASGIEGQNVSHTILVYDETTGFVNQSFKLTQTGDVSSISDIERNMTVRSSVDRLNGVARVNGDGVVAANETVAPTIADLLTVINAGTGLNPNVTYDESMGEGGPTLDASMTTYVGGANETVTVETLDDWASPTQYRWVHVAVSETGDVKTSSGQFNLPTDNSVAAPDDGKTTDPNAGDDKNKNNNNGNRAPVGGGGGGGSVNPPSTLTDVTTENGQAKVSVKNVRKGESIKIGFQQGQAASKNAQLDGIEVTPGIDMAHFEMGVTPLETAPDGTPAVSGSFNSEPVSFFKIDHTISNDEVEGVTYTFSVKKSSLDGQDPKNVALYRFVDGEWTELETELVGRTSTTFEFSADSPGLSLYAIGTKQPDISVTDASLDGSTIETGETATVSATVTNEGDGAGTYTLEFTANGKALAETQVRLEGGETKTVTLDHAFDTAGEYDIAVDGVSAGTLTVTSSAVETTAGDGETTVTTTTTPDDGQDGGIPLTAWVFLAIMVVAIGAGAVYFVRQQQ